MNTVNKTSTPGKFLRPKSGRSNPDSAIYQGMVKGNDRVKHTIGGLVNASAELAASMIVAEAKAKSVFEEALKEIFNIPFTTPGGENLIIISRDEFDRAIEDAVDVALARRVQDAVSSGDDEYISDDVAKRLMDGDDHPVKIYREYRGLKQGELANLASITAPMVSDIENRKTNAGLSVYIKLAKALNVGLEDIVPADMWAD